MSKSASLEIVVLQEFQINVSSGVHLQKSCRNQVFNLSKARLHLVVPLGILKIFSQNSYFVDTCNQLSSSFFISCKAGSTHWATFFGQQIIFLFFFEATSLTLLNTACPSSLYSPMNCTFCNIKTTTLFLHPRLSVII